MYYLSVVDLYVAVCIGTRFCPKYRGYSERNELVVSVVIEHKAHNEMWICRGT